MKTYTRLFPMLALSLTLLVLLTAIMPVMAQNPTRRAKNRVNWRLNREVDKKVDEAVGEALEKLLTKDKKEKEAEAGAEKGENPDVEVNESGEMTVKGEDGEVTLSVEEADENEPVVASDFTGSFTMEVDEYKKGKQKKDMPVRIRYHFDAYKVAFEVLDEKSTTTMIIDRENRKMTTKIDDGKEKTATIMPMLKIKVAIDKEEWEEMDVQVEPTGKTKTIEGYLCREYRVETEEEVTLAWMTDELGFDFSTFLDMVAIKGQAGQNAAQFGNIYGMEGMMLEAHTEVKGKEEERHTYLKNIRTGSNDPKVFSLEGYQVNDLSSMFGN